MEMDNYQEYIKKFVITTRGTGELEASYGLLEEAGEVAACYKRFYRNDNAEFAEAIFRDNLIKELGDVLFYITRLAEINGYSLAQVAQANLDKLDDRLARQVIQGTGDNR